MFCSRNSVGSSDVENLVPVSPTEEQNASVMPENCRPEVSDVSHQRVPGLRTALHRCAMVGNRETMAALIVGGCAVDLQDQDGNTALHEVSWHGFSQCLKLLIKAGADVHVQNKMGNTALHLACQNGHAPTAQLLLLRGSKPDAKNKVGDTCLHVAARYNNLDLLKILLRSRSCVSETNQAGDTALHVASALNHHKAVHLLLAAGVDVRVRNKAGKTALDRARDNQNKQVVLLLTKHHQVRYLRIKTRKRRVRARAPAEVSSPVVEEAPSCGQTDSRSATKHLNEGDLTQRKTCISQQKGVFHDGDGNRKLQLYALDRDAEGSVTQAPGTRCLCESQLKRLEGHLRVTEEEVRLQILNIQEEVSRRLDRMEHRIRHQLRVLDLMNQERAAAERRNMMSRMKQSAAQDRAEALRAQAVMRHELKSWCLSLLEDRDLQVPPEAPYHRLLRSGWAELSAAETDPESVPLLSSSADSSSSLSRHTLKSRCAESLMRNRKHSDLKVDRSADQTENPRPPSEDSSGLLQVSAAPSWQPAALQDSPGSAECGRVSSDSSRSTSAPQGPLEFFTDQPAEPTFSTEVTQHFFDAVTAQLERWCLTKILEVEQQMELRAQLDRKELLQRIKVLEEELHGLRTNEKKEI